MKLLMRLILTITFLNAWANVYADGSSGERELKYVRVVDNLMITATAATGTTFNNPDNCGDSSIAVVNATEAGADKKLTLMLSAFMSGKKIGMWFNGCVSTPWGYTAPHVYTIYVTN